MPKIRHWTLSGDTKCRFCNYEDYASITLTEPPETPHAVTCEACGRESAEFLPDFTLSPLDPSADYLTEHQED